MSDRIADAFEALSTGRSPRSRGTTSSRIEGDVELDALDLSELATLDAVRHAGDWPSRRGCCRGDRRSRSSIVVVRPRCRSSGTPDDLVDRCRARGRRADATDSDDDLPDDELVPAVPGDGVDRRPVPRVERRSTVRRRYRAPTAGSYDPATDETTDIPTAPIGARAPKRSGVWTGERADRVLRRRASTTVTEHRPKRRGVPAGHRHLATARGSPGRREPGDSRRRCGPASEMIVRVPAERNGGRVRLRPERRDQWRATRRSSRDARRVVRKRRSGPGEQVIVW